jgi:hypothetical protein
VSAAHDEVVARLSEPRPLSPLLLNSAPALVRRLGLPPLPLNSAPALERRPGSPPSLKGVNSNPAGGSSAKVSIAPSAMGMKADSVPLPVLPLRLLAVESLGKEGAVCSKGGFEMDKGKIIFLLSLVVNRNDGGLAVSWAATDACDFFEEDSQNQIPLSR